MPKFPVVSGKFLMKFLEKNGFLLMRIVGSHYVYTLKSPDGPITTVVPNHKELDIGTTRGILKQACIEVEVFLRYVG